MTWEAKIVGRTVKSAVVGDDYRNGDTLTITFEDGSYLLMQHYQDCCESVSLEEYSVEELAGLAGQTIVSVYETTDYTETAYGDQQYTFYSLQGNRTSATLRWYGESNGCYSVGVTVEFNDS